MRFFADELPLAPIVPEQAVVIVIVFGVVLVLLNVAAAAVVIIASLKRKPAIEAEFATKKEVAAGFDRVDNDIKHLDRRSEEIAKQIFLELKTLTTSISHEFSSLNRSIGKIEGRQEELTLDFMNKFTEAMKK